VLFSPASPSYGTYVNFEERGEHFRRLVRNR
jgi:UDP-N-acetylmuramoylalanine-D-glutamate ligase